MNLRATPALWMWAAYFAFYAGIACWAPYIPLYYQDIGLSGAEIGILTAIPPLGMAFLAPVWGYAADARSAHRLILQIALLSTAVVAVAMANVSGFWLVLPLVLTIALIGSTASPLLDSYAVIISAKQGVGFGQLRIGGSIGYTVIVWLIGYLMGGNVSRLFLFVYAGTLLLTALITIRLPAQRAGTTQDRWRGAADIVRQPQIRVLLLTVFLLSVGTSPVFMLFGLYVKAIGGGTAILGASSAAAAISELPIFFLGRTITNRFGSRLMFSIAIAFFVLRILLYTLVPSAEWVLAVQLLHGLSFGLYLIASVTLIHELVSPEYTATAQGLLASAMAFGQMSGALGGGILLDRIGIVAVYQLATGITVLALVVFVLGLRRYSRTVVSTAHT